MRCHLHHTTCKKFVWGYVDNFIIFKTFLLVTYLATPEKQTAALFNVRDALYEKYGYFLNTDFLTVTRVQ